MPITGLNHAVLYVRDVARSLDFYEGVLGFRLIPGAPRALRMPSAFLQAPGSTNDHDLALFEIGEQAGPSEAGHGTVGLYHLAWEVDTLAELERLSRALEEQSALTRANDHGATKSVYGRDPDGLEFELTWIVPAEALDDDALAARTRIRRLDFAKERARYGAETPGGIGISR
jgi:catechol 2,3-dioxygenase-like lactoylglutathione lyase family enzyme